MAEYSPAASTSSAGSVVGLITRSGGTAPGTATPGPPAGLFGETPFNQGPFSGLSRGPGLSTVPFASGSGFGTGEFGDAPFGEGVAGSAGRAVSQSSALPARGTSIAPYRTAATRAIALRAQPLDVGALLDEAVASADRVPTFSLRADWDGNDGYSHPLSDLTPVVEEFTVSREVATDLPAVVGLIAGTAATSVEVALGGRWEPSGPIESSTVLTPYTLLPQDATLSAFYTANYTLALEFSVTEPVEIHEIRYLRATVGVSASAGALFDVETQTEVPDTRVTFGTPPAAPSWHSVSLPTPFVPVVGRRYKVGVLFSGFGQMPDYFTGSGTGAADIDRGPLRRYSAAGASGGVQGSYNFGATLTYPGNGDADGKLYGVDIVALSRVELAGNPTAATTDPVKALAPYRRDADLAGKPVIGRRVLLTTGMQTSQGPVALPRMTGTVSAFEPSAADRRVRMRLLDDVNRLRAPIFQQAWGTDSVLRQMWGEGYPARINSQWLIDRVLRANGFFASPAPGVPLDDPDLMLSVTMHGAPIAETAAYSSQPIESAAGVVAPQPDPWVVGDHPFGMLAPNPAAAIVPKGSWHMRHPVVGVQGSIYAMSGWFRLPAAGSTLTKDLFTIYASNGPNYFTSNNTRLVMALKNGAPAAAAFGVSGTGAALASAEPLPETPTWVFCGFAWQFTSTGVTVRIYRGDVGSYDEGTISFAPYIGVDWNPNPTVAYEAAVPFTNLSMWRASEMPTTDWTGVTWSPTAQVDRGANTWGGIPEIRGRESYDLIKEIVEAEYAAFGFDEPGVPRFRSRVITRLTDRSETVTADRSLTDLVTMVDESTLANYVPATASRLELGWWEPIIDVDDPDEYTVPANSSRVFYFTLPDDVGQTWSAGINGPARYLSADDWNSQNAQGVSPYLTYSASYVENIWLAVTNADRPTMGANRLDARTMMLIVSNPSSLGIRFGTPNVIEDGQNLPGTGALRIPGRLVKPGNPVSGGAAAGDSVTTYGQRTYTMPDSTWRQNITDVNNLAIALLEWTGFPRPVLAEIDVPHNPRRKLHDPITVVDPEGLGSVSGKLAAIHTTFSASEGARDRLLVRPLAPPSGW